MGKSREAEALSIAKLKVKDDSGIIWRNLEVEDRS